MSYIVCQKQSLIILRSYQYITHSKQQMSRRRIASAEELPSGGGSGVAMVGEVNFDHMERVLEKKVIGFDGENPHLPIVRRIYPGLSN